MRPLPSATQVPRLARRWAAFLLLLASLVPVIVYRSWIDAQTSAFVVLATTIDTPVLGWIAAASTDSPRIEEVRVAGQEATVVRPGAGKRWPAVVFVNGATEEGHLHPEVQRLARGLARARFLVVVPELPGLRRGEITLRTLSSLLAVAQATANRPDAEHSRVGLVGVSVGSSLALVAAEHEALNGRISGVAGIAPYADLKEVARLATTGQIRAGDRLQRYDPDDFVLLAVARSLAAGLSPGRDRERLVALLATIPNERDDPLRGVRLPQSAGRGAQALLEFSSTMTLSRSSGSGVDCRYGFARRRDACRRSHTLTGLRGPSSWRRRPATTTSRLRSRAASRVRRQHVRVTVTEALSHALPEPSFHSLGAALRFDGFVVRSLRALRG